MLASFVDVKPFFAVLISSPRAAIFASKAATSRSSSYPPKAPPAPQASYNYEYDEELLLLLTDELDELVFLDVGELGFPPRADCRYCT